MRQHAGAKLIVAELDRRLVLDPQQRERLVEVIETGYPRAWAHAGYMSLQNNQYFPLIPDRLLTPVLKPNQISGWQALQKADFTSWGVQFQFSNQFGAIDDFPVDEEQ